MVGAGHGHEFCLADGGATVARERAHGAERRANAGLPLTVGFENPGGPAYVRLARSRTSPGTVSGRRERAGGAGGRAHRATERAGGMSGDESGFFDTRRAADYLGLSHRTLDGYRVSGDGPAFHRFGNRVRYRRSGETGTMRIPERMPGGTHDEPYRTSCPKSEARA